MAGLKIKEAELIDELTEDCLFPISDGSDKPRVANFVKVKEFLGDTKQAEKDINDLQRKINYLTRNGLDSGMSVREISEEVLSPTATNVETLIGIDRDKSVRTIATEVLAGASTGGGIDLDLYLSKSEAEATYATKENLDDKVDTLNKADAAINNNISNINGRLVATEEKQTAQGSLITQLGSNVTTLAGKVANIEKRVKVVVIDNDTANNGTLIVEDENEGYIIVN